MFEQARPNFSSSPEIYLRTKWTDNVHECDVIWKPHFDRQVCKT